MVLEAPGYLEEALGRLEESVGRTTEALGFQDLMEAVGCMWDLLALHFDDFFTTQH